ncbi:TonB-dependent receptor [bacterium]|nr:TonB-dependent receptor [bacterium]
MKYRILVLLFILGSTVFSATLQHDGSIYGIVVDSEVRTPLIGTNVMIKGSVLGAASDMQGRFSIKNIPPGNYTLVFMYMGYERRIITDVIVRPGRNTQVDAAMTVTMVSGESVTVTGAYFQKIEEAPTSSVSFSNEEIRRAPGSAGDVSRIIMGLPSIAKVNDQQNSLIVRGGSPLENGFYIDGIEIPNINHFPMQGASGGPIGMVNVDFIQDVSFMAGGFSAEYGNRLSSIMNMKFREGSKESVEAQLDLNWAGFGGVAEGPLPGGKGAWMFSVRRSYLDLIVDAIDIGTSVAPRYGDFQGKVFWDVSPAHRIYALWLWGDDHSTSDQETGADNDMLYYGDQDLLQGATGLGWRALWRDKGYSTTTLSYLINSFDETFYDTGSKALLLDNHSEESKISLRHISHFRLDKAVSMDFGLDAQRLVNEYKNLYAGTHDATGGVIEPLVLNKNLKGNRLGAHVSLSLRPTNRLSITLGGRGDWSELSGQTVFSPRAAFSFKFSDRFTLNGAGGQYYQELPALILAQRPDNAQLDWPKAVHGVIGIEHMLSESTRLSVEGYVKSYDQFPMDAMQPGLFLIDEIVYQYGFFTGHGALSSKGKARSYGVEIVFQKKLADKIYGMISGAWFRSQYKDLEGVWKDRVFDNQFVFNVEGGYKPNSRWEFSIRWMGAGGAPYTPMNLTASAEQNRAVLDGSLINESRYPTYHSMNIRVDRRFQIGGSTLVAYLSVWNVYARKNIAQYFWNTKEQRQDAITQWTRLPIFGLEYEF